MLKVAVTGGIGSGKSIVCKVFRNLGIPIFNADSVAKELMNNNMEIRRQFIEWFGQDIYQENGDIHRKKLAEIIFNDNIALQKVNETIHPAVFNEFIQWAKVQTSPYVMQEAAIIFENGHTDRFDKIITVTAPVEVKISRCMKRDKVSRELVEDRMKNQLPDEYKINRSDFVIVNDDSKMILPQILNIHNTLI